MFPKENKWCFVPSCKSTSKSTPDKIFVTVPKDYSRKKSWFKAAGRDLPKGKTVFFCCEDHFDLETDLENYTRYKLIGGKIILKPKVVPHIFHCRSGGRKRTASNNEGEIEAKYANIFGFEQVSDEEQFPIPSLLCEVTESVCTRDIGVNVKPSFRSKYITCNLLKS